MHKHPTSVYKFNYLMLILSNTCYFFNANMILFITFAESKVVC